MGMRMSWEEVLRKYTQLSSLIAVLVIRQVDMPVSNCYWYPSGLVGMPLLEQRVDEMRGNEGETQERQR